MADPEHLRHLASGVSHPVPARSPQRSRREQEPHMIGRLSVLTAASMIALAAFATPVLAVGEPVAPTVAGPASVVRGAAAQISGTAAPGAGVELWVRKQGAADFVLSRSVTADGT